MVIDLLSLLYFVMGFEAVFNYYEGLTSPRITYLETVQCRTMQCAGLQTGRTRPNEKLKCDPLTKKETHMT